MSLLMQALRKAESAKQGAEVQAEVASSSLSEAFPEFDSSAGRKTALSLEELALSPMTPRHPPPETEKAAVQPDARVDADAGPPAEAQSTAEYPASEMQDALAHSSEPVTATASDLTDRTPATATTEPVFSDAELARARTMQARQAAAARKKADVVFAAKKPRPMPAYRLVGIAVLFLAFAGGGGYLAWMLMAPPENVYPPMPSVTSLPGSVGPSAVDDAAPGGNSSRLDGADAQPGTAIVASVVPEVVAAGTAVETSVPAVGRVAAIEPVPRSLSAPAAAPSPDRSPNRAGPLEPSQPAIEVHRAPPPVRVDPVLSAAYKALVQGDLGSAQQQYQKVLHQDPNNRDALLGLATIATAGNQQASAAAYYDRMMEIDPADPDAVAAIAARDADLARSESRLKRALNERPDAAVLHFALGNVYARQARWSEAQRSYFRAYASAPENGNYIFNLAVSLDKLEQARLAAEFYRKALDTGSRDLDRRAIEIRIADLQGALEHGAR